MRLTRRNRYRRHLAIPMAMCLIVLNVLSTRLAHAAPQAPDPGSKPSSEKAKTELEQMSLQPVKPVYPQTMSGASQAYKDKNYQDALAILLKLESDYAGKVEYDYLLGRCALETRQFDVAVAAFTRALTVDPNFAAARFELARTYYSKGVALLARGPFEQARSEFGIIAKMNPPTELKQAIDGYQANIDKYLKEREAEFNIYVETMGGYDSNIGTRSSHDSFSYYDPGIPATNTYDLNNKNETGESSYMQIKTGAGIAWPLFSKYFEVFGNVEVAGRFYASNHGYDHTWEHIKFGARHYGKRDKKTLLISFRKTDILGDLGDRQRYHEEGSVGLFWEFKNTQNSTLKLFAKGGDSNYQAHGTYVFSVNYNRQGIETTYLTPGKRKSTLSAMYVMGEDYEQQCDFPPCPGSYARKVNGLQLAWGVNIFDSSRFYSSLYVENSEYHRDFFFQKRRDSRSELFMGINTRMGKSWYFRPEIHYTENRSNLTIFEHERWLINMRLGWSL